MKKDGNYMKYYSNEILGNVPREYFEINSQVWIGIVASVKALLLSNYFSEKYPVVCPDGSGPIGTDESLFGSAMIAEIPALVWPLETKKLSSDGFLYDDWAPDTFAILDLIQFCFSVISKPILGSYHKYFNHYHLSFNESEGKKEFREKINTIFERNGIAYSLENNGSILRIKDIDFVDELRRTVFQTGDSILDGMLNESRSKYLKPKDEFRIESVERLWDSWERIKSLIDPNKRKSVELLISKSSIEPKFKELLDDEAKTLTSIGNNFKIRHTEIDKTPITDRDHLDYLFKRMFALIKLFLEKM